ncbi:glycoside hydrolase family 3 N-terminal domain-containing protein [Pseudobacteroides cellulosolvens]|uniref:beta-glucosidase n=1 Tax=Pseudobacteroides cellulosolvens ATCC 35603 = DSM 2933 TaxID=398512 RepID=A0A0L6JW30_9FIRM|nr:glycoside hydrolase family 3 N-terminal domain-containing protein [Pseudobacteroides cellulosolvens]KNY30043.1 Beta-glucosidase [Pseudobacteroides cellulosolvens ATCC 35603 = DSM 2933]
MKEIYKDPAYSPVERTKDLLSRMTLEEKVGQMCQIDGRENPEFWINERHIGSFLHVRGKEAQRLQEIAGKTRLGIPIIFGIDAIHGHGFYSGATVFPSQLAAASSWNPDILQEMAAITAKEVSLTGLHWTFSPVICLGRDARWGRVDETFGEDPYLAGILAAAMVKGYQGEKLSDPYSILACAKHYVAYGETVGGRDSTECDVPERKVRSTFLPPFKTAADAGCATFMTAYHAIDGLPCTANKVLLKDILKDEWKLNGFIVTDWDNVGHMHRLQKTASDMKKSAELAILAGNDMMMSTPEFYECAIELVKEGVIEEEIIDEACGRILETKFRLGLFDDKRYTDFTKAQSIIGCAEHKKASFECALESIVLLKNENNVLPVSDKVRKIAVIGPNAHDVEAQLGDWTFGPRYYPEKPMLEYNEYDITPIVTILDGIKKRAGNKVEIVYDRGCDMLDASKENIAGSVKLAQEADMVIAVVGDTILLNGEVRDRSSLDLTGAQQKLLEALKITGKPLVVVLINGKPLTVPWIKDNADSIIEAWNPGMEGGNAVAAILFGDYNPCGKITISFPRNVGQQPVYYNQYSGWHGPARYIDVDPEPLFSFGYGLSYTSYKYSNMSITPKEIGVDGEITVSVDITNTGSLKGTEIVQLYINDIYSSVTTPIKELKGFARVTIDPGQTKNVKIKLPAEALSLINRELKRVVEPGEFEIMIGSSSRDCDLLKDIIRVIE